MLENFSMWIPYIENHMPTKIHAYPNHNMETYFFLACRLVKFTKKHSGGNLVLGDKMGMFLKPIFIQNNSQNLVSNPTLKFQFGYQTKNIWAKYLL
jgi:hypothetical protein